MHVSRRNLFQWDETRFQAESLEGLWQLAYRPRYFQAEAEAEAEGNASTLDPDPAPILPATTPQRHHPDPSPPGERSFCKWDTRSTSRATHPRIVHGRRGCMPGSHDTGHRSGKAPGTPRTRRCRLRRPSIGAHLLLRDIRRWAASEGRPPRGPAAWETCRCHQIDGGGGAASEA